MWRFKPVQIWMYRVPPIVPIASCVVWLPSDTIVYTHAFIPTAASIWTTLEGGTRTLACWYQPTTPRTALETEAGCPEVERLMLHAACFFFSLVTVTQDPGPRVTVHLWLTLCSNVYEWPRYITSCHMTQIMVL